MFVVDVDSEYVISLLAFNHNGDGEATASTVRTSPASGRTLLLSLPTAWVVACQAGDLRPQ